MRSQFAPRFVVRSRFLARQFLTPKENPFRNFTSGMPVHRAKKEIPVSKLQWCSDWGSSRSEE